MLFSFIFIFLTYSNLKNDLLIHIYVSTWPALQISKYNLILNLSIIIVISYRCRLLMTVEMTFITFVYTKYGVWAAIFTPNELLTKRYQLIID